MSRKVKIALGQITSKVGDVRYNIKKAEEFIARAAAEGADIICLPELFPTGYNLDILRDKAISLSLEYSSFISDSMSKAAKGNGIYIIAPFGEFNEKDGKVYNGAALYDRSGKRLGHYYKTHNFSTEKEYFAKGRDYPVFETDIGKIGIIICYDAGFPEAARTLCLKGAEIIFIPAAWRIQDENSWLLNIPSRALENQLYTVGVNRSGHEGDLHLFGKSMVCDPFGNVVMQMGYDLDEVAVMEINLDEIENCRKQYSYLHDRRPGIYRL